MIFREPTTGSLNFNSLVQVNIVHHSLHFGSFRHNKIQGYFYFVFTTLTKLFYLCLMITLLHNLISYFWSFCFNTDHYFYYLYLHNFRLNNIFSHNHISIIKEQTKVRGKHQNPGSVLTEFWPLRRRPTYLFNSLVSCKYHQIRTITSQYSLWFSHECGILSTKLLIQQLEYSCWFGHMSKFFPSNLRQGHYFSIQ